MDVDARIQLFDLKTKYSFQTSPGVDQYNMPLYNVQQEPAPPPDPIGIFPVAMFPVYQGFVGPAYVNGAPVSFETQKSFFFSGWQNLVQNYGTIIQGDGTAGPYTINFPILPNSTAPQNPPFNAILRGHVDINGIIATGVNVDPPLASDSATFATRLGQIPSTSIDSAVYITSIDSNGANVVVADSGVFLASNVNLGLLMQPGNAPFGNAVLPGGYSATSNVVNYLTGTAIVTFPVAIPAGNNINVQCSFFSTGLPRAILYYNNVLTLRSPPDRQYLVELDTYLSPAAFLNMAQAIPFGYMAEYIARGAARKILSDTGDGEQLAFYEPLFREQEMLVWKRSQRQWTANRTETIYSRGSGMVNGWRGWGGNSL